MWQSSKLHSMADVEAPANSPVHKARQKEHALSMESSPAWHNKSSMSGLVLNYLGT